MAAYGLAWLAPAPVLDRITARFPRLETLRTDFVSHPFRYTLSMRLMPLTPFTLVSLAAGLNRIGLAPFTLGTILGVAPECIIYATIGAGLSGSLANGRLSALAGLNLSTLWIGLAALAVAALASVGLQRRRN